MEPKLRNRLYLNNTLSGEKDPFENREEKRVKLFTCGPSIYSRAHIGNYRTFLYEDILQRYLEYLGYEVERMINFTDVEDKSIAEAQDRGIDLRELTSAVEKQFLREAGLFSLKLPDNIPRSSTSVKQAVHLIKLLMDKGYAYRHKKDIFYDPLKFKGFGKLYGLDMSKWPRKKRRFYKDTYPGRRWNLGDFILWRGSDLKNVYWETEIGRGRPAWNIQDAAMITENLDYKIDIACGGVDNLYRHHDYTIAVIEAVTGETFAPYWLHGEHVLTDGVKMSKSRGNILYPEHLAEKGYKPAFIRFHLIYSHYRQTLDITEENLERTTGKLASTMEMIRQLLDKNYKKGKGNERAEKLIDNLEDMFKKNMNDDLDVKGAFDGMTVNLRKLVDLKKNGIFDSRDAGKLSRTLAGINTILQVLDI